MEIFNAWKGLFYIIKEKLPLHAIVVRYLRFGPDQQNSQAESSDALNDMGISYIPAFGGAAPSDKSIRKQSLFGEGSRSRSSMIEPSVLPDKFAAYVGSAQNQNNVGSSHTPHTLGDLLQQANSALEEQGIPPGCNGSNAPESVSSDLIVASADIIQDMAVCVAEMVATLYLADFHSMDKNVAGEEIVRPLASVNIPAGRSCSVLNRALEHC